MKTSYHIGNDVQADTFWAMMGSQGLRMPVQMGAVPVASSSYWTRLQALIPGAVK